MVEPKDIGEIRNIPYIIKHVEWEIPDCFENSVAANDYVYKSPSFSTDDASWILRLWPWWNSVDKPTMLIDITNQRGARRAYTLGYCLGLKNCDGTVEELVCGNLKRNARCSRSHEFMKKTELLKRKTELMPSNTLTVACTLKWKAKISCSAEPTGLDKIKSMKLTRLDKLSENFKDLYADKETCDVTLKVHDQEFKAHSQILMARSKVFAAAFKHDMLERQLKVIIIPDCDPYSFKEFLEYVYCGELKELSFRSALNLYYISDKYDMEELKEFCNEYLMQCLSEKTECLTVENVCEIALFSDTYGKTVLLDEVQKFFNENYLSIFLSTQWKDLLKNNGNLAGELLEKMAKLKLEDCVPIS